MNPNARGTRQRIVAMMTMGLLVAGVLVGSGTLEGQDSTSDYDIRLELIIGAITPQADDYTGSGHLKPEHTFPETAVIPGLPVRQHPVNLGLFQAGGCAQCHRINAPLPLQNDAPADVFLELYQRSSMNSVAPPPPGFVQLTHLPGREEFPVWSPDGQLILYSADNGDNHWNLWVMKPDGSGQIQLTSELSAGWGAWSADGDRIVYWVADKEDRGNVWVMNADGSGKRQLTHEEMTAFPQWNPIGSQIVYQARRAGKWSIWLVSADGTDSSQISPSNQYMVGNPQWSPDGTQIIYQVSVGESFELWRLIFPLGSDGKPDYSSTPMAQPSSTLLPMDIGLGQSMGAWSPDSQRVAYLMVTLQLLPTGQEALTYKTWVSDADGLNPTLIMPTGTLGDRDPTWSPDGRWVAYWSWNPDLIAGIWIVRADGSQAVHLTKGFEADALYPTWSPDSTKIAFASNWSGSFDIWASRVNVEISPKKATAKEENEVLCALRSTTLALEPNQSESSEVAITAEVNVLERQGDWGRVRLDGWQQQDVPSIIYALQGIRIRKAQLEENAQQRVVTLNTITDPNTEITWKEVTVSDVWVPKEDLTDNLEPVWEEARQFYETTCTVCHELYEPDLFLANQWPGTVEEMGNLIGLDKNSEKLKLITSYLQYNARDTKEMEEIIPCGP